MSIRRALLENNINEFTDFDLYIEKFELLKQIRNKINRINDRIGKGYKPYKKQIISLYESLSIASDLKFDIGKVDNVDLFRFLDYVILTNEIKWDLIILAFKYADSGISPKKYDYGKINLYKLLIDEEV